MPQFRHLPLRRKLVLLLWTMSVTTLVLTATVALIAQLLLARRQANEDLGAQAQVLADAVAAAVDFDDAPAAVGTLRALALTLDLRRACVYLPQGQLFAAFQPRSVCPEQELEPQTLMGRREIRVGHLVSQGGRGLGHVTLVRGLGAVYRQVGIQLAVLTALLIAIAPLGLVVSSWLESLVSTRILRLSDAAAQIGTHTPLEPGSITAVPVDSRDEIGQLTNTFNDMVARLAQQEGALRAANTGLERRVAVRTAELAAELGERHRAEALLAQRNAALTRANQDLEDFAYITSHDLKEPLRGIQHYASFLTEDYGPVLDEAGRNQLAMLGRLASRMEALIDSLLHYSRVGQVEVGVAPVDLDELVQEVLESVAVTIAKAGAQVHVAPLPRVRCDRARVAEIFANLIVNAIKYSDKVPPRIDVGAETGAGGTPSRFYVRDNGIGIADKHRDTVFRIFKRLHARDAYGGGVGAGLTIVRKIVERHGGRVWLESEVAIGTTAWFTLEDGDSDDVA